MLRFCGLVALSALLSSDLLSQQAITGRTYGLTPPYRELSVNGTNCNSFIRTLSCAQEGVTFNSAVYLSNTDDLFNPFSQVGQGSVANGVNTNIDFSVSILFDRQVRSAAFNILGFNASPTSFITFDVFNNKKLVSSFTSADRLQFMLAPSESLAWWGFEDSVFDEIVITAPFAVASQTDAPVVYTMALNNLQIKDAVPEPAVIVPEPSTVALAILGMSGLAIVSRRRRR